MVGEGLKICHLISARSLSPDGQNIVMDAKKQKMVGGNMPPFGYYVSPYSHWQNIAPSNILPKKKKSSVMTNLIKKERKKLMQRCDLTWKRKLEITKAKKFSQRRLKRKGTQKVEI